MFLFAQRWRNLVFLGSLYALPVIDSACCGAAGRCYTVAW